jgi:hypothetical protein
MIDDEGVMVLPEQPFVPTGAQAVADAPRWTQVTFSERQIMRPQEGLIAIAYKDEPGREASTSYTTYYTTTMRRLSHDEWRVVQHQQNPALVASVA